MHLKEDIYKKLIFSPKKWQSSKIMRFLSITLLRRLFLQIYVCFSESPQNYGFFIPMKTYFEQKNWTLFSDFCHFGGDKNLHYYAKSQNREKCLSTLILEFWSQSIYIFRFSRFQHWPTLLYTVQCTVGWVKFNEFYNLDNLRAEIVAK